MDDRKLPKRKEIRLDGFDYSEPYFYYVTICTEGRKNILGEIVGGDPLGAPKNAGGDPWNYSVGMPYTKLSKAGNIVLANFKYINENLDDRRIDCFCIMPNHVHFIIKLIDAERRGGTPLPPACCRNGSDASGSQRRATPTDGDGSQRRATPTLADAVKAFKYNTKKQSGIELWQRNYYEHIIRDERDLRETREYILENPLKWVLDKYYTG